MNHRDVLERARHKSKREIELLIATLHPRADVPSVVRKLPTPMAPTLPPPAPRNEATPETPTSDAAVAPARPVLLRLLIADLERTRMAKVGHPRVRVAKKHSRHIPAAIKRSVWQRDNGRCVFKGPHGRCAETGFLEYHHVVPFADGGESSPSNLELRCRAHNQYEADLWFGAAQPPLFARETRAMFGT